MAKLTLDRLVEEVLHCIMQYLLVGRCVDVRMVENPMVYCSALLMKRMYGSDIEAGLSALTSLCFVNRSLRRVAQPYLVNIK